MKAFLDDTDQLIFTLVGKNDKITFNTQTVSPAED